ncbi:glycoside hydrolase family 24 protein [Burkholderia gladioli]|uniref:glycoside hydrolase family 24 protein n=1 Tax=Burkholderia gladioli TaxID=28095 RepID=UPI0031334C56
MSDNTGLVVLVLAAGAAALLWSSGAAASFGGPEADSASDNVTDILSGAQGDLLDMTTSYGSAGSSTGNRQAFLDMIALSECGAALLAVTDNGYNVLVGATAANPMTFSDYSAHPDVLNRALDSTAAGRYQINFPTFRTLSRQTGLTDFSPSTQDAMALQLVANKGALNDVDAGNIQAAIAKCAPVWASLPGWTYGQHTNSVPTLLAWYQAQGGALA